MELCDASATDVKVFHLILSAHRLVLSQTIIIRAIIIAQGIGRDKIPFIIQDWERGIWISWYLSENDITGQVQFSNIVLFYLYFPIQWCKRHRRT